MKSLTYFSKQSQTVLSPLPVTQLSFILDPSGPSGIQACFPGRSRRFKSLLIPPTNTPTCSVKQRPLLKKSPVTIWRSRGFISSHPSHRAGESTFPQNTQHVLQVGRRGSLLNPHCHPANGLWIDVPLQLSFLLSPESSGK